MNKLQTELVDETFDKLIDLCIEMEKKGLRKMEICDAILIFVTRTMMELLNTSQEGIDHCKYITDHCQKKWGDKIDAKK